jgi:hypothetical protein
MTGMKKSLRAPQSLWWLAVGVLAIVIVLLIARRLYG